MKLSFRIFLLLLLWILTAAVYYRGLSGPFIFDDIPNIERNKNIAIQNLDAHTLMNAALSSASSALGRPLSMVSFAVNYYMTGLNPTYFKLTNLAIHLVNGAGIFVLTTLLLGFYKKQWQSNLSDIRLHVISLAATGGWLLHPFNLTGVLYIVQRMTSLSALFTIWGLALFCWGRIRLYEGKDGIITILASVLVFTPLAFVSKENGVLLPLFMLITEIVFFKMHAVRVNSRRFLGGLYLCSVALPLVTLLIYSALHPQWILGGFPYRSFTLTERLMTETRVLWFYIGQIILPANGQMGLFHDDIAISRSLFYPISTFFSIMGIVALTILSIALRKKAPIIAFGVMLFLSGHLLESTIFPLDLAYEHRNYFPSFGLLLPLFFYLLHPLAYPDTLRVRQVLTGLFIALLMLNTFSRAQEWSNPFDLFRMEVERHPQSVRSQVEIGALYSRINTTNTVVNETNYLLSRMHFERAFKLDKNDTGGLFGLIFLHAERNKPIKREWILTLEERLARAPYPAIVSDKLLALATCKLEGRCKLTDADIENLLKASLSNPTNTGGNRAKALFAYSSYLINIKRDYEGALAVMREMVAAAPKDLAYRFTLIEFLSAMRRYEAASLEIHEARTLDSRHQYDSQLTKLELRLQEAQAQMKIQ